jgi:phenylalanyl-tRNA synthetase beta chain
VDITNYLTLERGRPMHAFDQAKLQGGIDVRYPRPGEEMYLLNEQHVVLQPDMLLIADESGAVAMGGVMGGLESMCTPETTSVFLESAYFDPAVIQGKTRTLGINSDAAFRFERGVDPNGTADGIEYATRLVLEICGTPETMIGPVTEGLGTLPARPAVLVRAERVRRLLGMPIPVADMVGYLQRLNCTVECGGDRAELLVTPPSYRFDLCIEEDFVEEIARIHGYEKVPAVPPVSSLPISALPEAGKPRHALRHRLAGMGYQEVINYSFVPEKWEADFSANTWPLRLANPISIQMGVMRTSLIGGLVSALRHNLNHGESRVKLFELGRCFLRDEVSLQAQPERVAGLMCGARFPEQWGEGGQKGEAGDFFAVKGEVEILLSGLNPRFERALHPALHPGRSAQICVDGRVVGHIGELHPKLSQEYDLTAATIVFEVEVSVFSTLRAPAFAPFSRMQSVRRDIALLVGDAVEIQSMIDEVMHLKTANLVDFSLFDLYRGQNLDSGTKSVAFRVVMQDTDRTLTDSEADSKVSEIVEVLSQKFGATLRK